MRTLYLFALGCYVLFDEWRKDRQERARRARNRPTRRWDDTREDYDRAVEDSI